MKYLKDVFQGILKDISKLFYLSILDILLIIDN